MARKKYFRLLSQLTRLFFHYLCDLKIVILFVVIFCFINWAIFTYVPDLSISPSPMSLSRDRPWGIVTAIFVHGNPEHLTDNLKNLLLFSTFFIVLSQLNSSSLRKRRGWRFVWVSFVSGIGANIVCYVFDVQLPAIGSSGVVSGTMGIVLGKLVFDLPISIKKTIRRSIYRKKLHSLRLRIKKLDDFRSFVSLVVLILIGGSLIMSPTIFFNVDENVGWVSHIIGFSLGLSGFWLLSARDFLSSRYKI